MYLPADISRELSLLENRSPEPGLKDLHAVVERFHAQIAHAG
jgi:hypothetical protein